MTQHATQIHGCQSIPEAQESQSGRKSVRRSQERVEVGNSDFGAMGEAGISMLSERRSCQPPPQAGSATPPGRLRPRLLRGCRCINLILQYLVFGLEFVDAVFEFLLVLVGLGGRASLKLVGAHLAKVGYWQFLVMIPDQNMHKRGRILGRSSWMEEADVSARFLWKFTLER